MPLYRKQTTVAKNRLPSSQYTGCAFVHGIMCEHHKICKGCIRGKKGKDVEVRPTLNMGKSLFSKEQIQPDDYIKPYDGKVLSHKPKRPGSYVAELKCFDGIKGKTTLHVDAEKSKSLGRFANHACNNNAILCKMIIPGGKLPNYGLRPSKR